MGIGDGHRVVVYDRNRFMASARVWWTFRVMGHREVFVLDGGLAAWIAAGGELEDLPPVPSERHHTVRVQSHLVRSRDQVRAASQSGAARILDARPAGRFSGEVAEPRPGLRQGHIPGSASLPSDMLLDGDRMKSPDELRALFAQAGVRAGQPVICTCGSGVTAAVLALGLARTGLDTAAVYDGSWAEWGADESLPLGTGSADRG
jgi:thiosulfate/3-mercaptopyruvate sulfurtransferase